MPNHFHLAVRIKPENEIIANLPKVLNFREVVNAVSKQFGNLFSSYAQSFNKQQGRKGILFEPNFERKWIDSDQYFRNLIHYVHFNPVHHGFVEDLRDWKHSSFESFFSEKSTKLKRDEVIQWFGDKENFYFFHQNKIDDKMFLDLEFL